MISQLPATGGYFNPVKVGLFLFLGLAWAATGAWADKDTLRVKVPRLQWNALVFGGGALGVALWLLIPSFWAGLAAFVVCYAGSSVTYCLYRNGKVAPAQQVLTVNHLKRLTQKKGKGDDAASSADKVRLKGADGKAPKWPTTPEERTSYRAMQEFLFDAIWRRASVVEVAISGEAAKVIYRVDGVNREREPIERPLADEAFNHLKRIAGMDVNEVRKPQAAKISGAVGPGGKQDKVVEIQIKTSGSSSGQRFLLTMHSEENKYRLTDLGLSQAQLALVQAAVEKPGGVVLVGGPKESGVTSTLYAFLRGHDAFLKNLQTLETAKVMDVENVTQHVYDSRGGNVAYHRQLQSILRMDPDVVMVSECADHETAELIAGAGKQKRRIYTGIVAADTLSTVRKYMQLVGDNELAAAGLELVLAERLVRVLCPSCRQAYKPDPTLIKRANLPASDTRLFYRPPNPDELETDKQGNPIMCQVCQGSGYLGRTGVFEVLVIDDEIRAMLSQGLPLTNVKAHARKNKLIYLQEAGLAKVFDGITSINEVLRVTRTEETARAPVPRT